MTEIDIGKLLNRWIEKVEFTDACWLWRASKDQKGYGHFGIGRGRSFRAHRVGYEFLVGPIPEGLTLDHLCRVRHCVNPDHLEPVTNRVNILRGEGIAGNNARKTECLNGHPLDEENTIVESYGDRHYRHCRTCLKKRQREHYLKNREQYLERAMQRYYGRNQHR